MSLTIIGGNLAPITHDGSTLDAVYGVDASGKYLGVVRAAQAFAQATVPAPSNGNYRWVSGAWQVFKSMEERALEIEAVRDATITAGVAWSNRTWPADAIAQQQLAVFLQGFTEGTMPAIATAGVRAKDKVVYQLTHLELRQLAAAVMVGVQTAYATSWTAKAAIGAP